MCSDEFFLKHALI